MIATCQRGYLLLPTVEGGTRLGHDTLAPLMRERFEESDRPGQRARRILESRAVEWGEDKQGAPLDDSDLRIVEDGQGGMRAWTEPETRLFATSRAAREKRTRQRTRYRVMGLIAIVAVALSTVLATWQWRVAEVNRMAAERQSRISLARQLAAEAQTIAIECPIRALLLAVEAERGPLEADGVRLGGPETVLRNLLASPHGLPLVHQWAAPSVYGFTASR